MRKRLKARQYSNVRRASRGDAQTDDAQLYRQAEANSQLLRQRVAATLHPFKASIQAINQGENYLSLSNVADCHEMTAQSQAYLEHLCRRISPDFAVPILVQSISDFYYGSDQRPAWLGTALKTALACIGANVFEPPSSRAGSLPRRGTRRPHGPGRR